MPGKINDDAVSVANKLQKHSGKVSEQDVLGKEGLCLSAEPTGLQLVLLLPLNFVLP